MNSKLKKFSFAEIRLSKSVHGRGGSAGSNALIRASCRKDKDASGDVINFTMHKRLMEMTGWKAGDRLSFTVDSGMVCLFPEPATGMCISPPGKKEGPNGRHRIRFGIKCGLIQEFFEDGAEVEVENGRVAFLLKAFESA